MIAVRVGGREIKRRMEREETTVFQALSNVKVKDNYSLPGYNRAMQLRQNYFKQEMNGKYAAVHGPCEGQCSICLEDFKPGKRQ